MLDAATLRALEQGSAEWLQARCGSAGASRVSEVVAKNKDGKTPSASRKNYRAELARERWTGRPAVKFRSKAMIDGNVREPVARALYSLATGNEVERVGLILHPTIRGAHASPDGLVGPDGLVSFKCPEDAQHFENLFDERVIDKAYRDQMQWEMACLPERRWCDFVSYNPEFPESSQLIIRRRIPRDNDYIIWLEGEVEKFVREVNEIIEDLNNRGYRTGE